MKILTKLIGHGLLPLIIFGGTLLLLAQQDALIYRLLNGTDRQPEFNEIATRDSYGYYHLPPHATYKKITFNKFGYNDEDDYDLEKPTGQYRIMIVGDSIATGTIDETPISWPTILENYLHQQLPARDIEVINTAMPANTINDYRKEYQHYWRRFQPDLVVIYHRPDRDYLVDHCQPLSRKRPIRSLLRSAPFLRRFFNYRAADPGQALIWQRVRNLIIPQIAPTEPAYFRRFTKDLTDLVKTIQDDDTTVMLVSPGLATDTIDTPASSTRVAVAQYTVPCLGQRALLSAFVTTNQLTGDIGQATQASYLDANNVLTFDPTNFLANDLYHLSEKGKSLLAEAIGERLLQLIEPL